MHRVKRLYSEMLLPGAKEAMELMSEITFSKFQSYGASVMELRKKEVEAEQELRRKELEAEQELLKKELEA